MSLFTCVAKSLNVKPRAHRAMSLWLQEYTAATLATPRVLCASPHDWGCHLEGKHKVRPEDMEKRRVHGFVGTGESAGVVSGALCHSYVDSASSVECWAGSASTECSTGRRAWRILFPYTHSLGASRMFVAALALVCRFKGHSLSCTGMRLFVTHDTVCRAASQECRDLCCPEQKKSIRKHL